MMSVHAWRARCLLGLLGLEVAVGIARKASQPGARVEHLHLSDGLRLEGEGTGRRSSKDLQVEKVVGVAAVAAVAAAAD